MGGLITDLSQSARALQAQQTGLELAGRNLANVNNPKYARQRVILGTNGTIQTPIGPQGMGVEATGIQQIRDQFLDAQVTREISLSSSLQAQDGQLQKAQADLGEQVDGSSASASISDSTTSTTGLNAALNNFFNAFDTLAANPTDTGSKQLLLQSASTLSGKLNATDARLSSLQDDITTQINSDVSTANGLLKNIASLNGQIQQLEVQPPHNTANDLRDERQADLEQLAQYVNFTATAIPGSYGQIQLTSQDANGNSVTLVNKTSVKGGGISFDGTQFTAGSPATALSLQGGSLEGNLNVRDGAIQQLRNSLATTATQLTSSVNKAYNPTGATGDFFQSGTLSSGLIALDPALNVNTLKTTDTGNAGANEIALAVAQVAQQKLSTSSGDLVNGTIGNYYSQTVTGLGQSISGVESQLSDQTIVQTMVQTQRDSVSGVSQDEELTDLMKYQRAFQAQARVINAIDNLLDVVVNGLFGH